MKHSESRALAAKVAAAYNAGASNASMQALFNLSAVELQTRLQHAFKLRLCKARPVGRPRGPVKPNSSNAAHNKLPARLVTLQHLAAGCASLDYSGRVFGVTRQRAQQLFRKAGLDTLRARKLPPLAALTNFHSLKDSGLRRCCKCRLSFAASRENFPPHSHGRPGLSARCHACNAENTNAWFARLSDEERLGKARAYREANGERMRAYKREWRKARQIKEASARARERVAAIKSQGGLK